MIHRRLTVSTDGDSRYPKACRLLKLEHCIHSSYGDILIANKFLHKTHKEEFGKLLFTPCRKEN